jgi:hypothetical protein
MWKAMLAGTAALTIVGASLVYAQQTPSAQQGRDGGSRFSRLSPEDRAALTDARIAGLKAGLKRRRSAYCRTLPPSCWQRAAVGKRW